MSRGPKDKKRPPAAPLPAKRSPYKQRLSENQLPQISNNDGCKVGGTARDRMRGVINPLDEEFERAAQSGTGRL
jgi:hypothetical protein